MSISHAPHMLYLLQIASNPKTLGSTVMIICPDKDTSTVTLPHTKVIPSLQCYIQILSPTPHYEDHTTMMNLPLDTANIYIINISPLDSRIWQHFNNNWTSSHLQKLANVPEVPVAQLYRHMVNTSEPVYSFTIKDDEIDNLNASWDIHRDYGYDFAVCTDVYCFKRIWIRPATLIPHSLLRHAIVDDNVEVAPIYRCRGRVEEPRRPHKNHNICTE